jgi:hypothetical protein
LGLELRCGTHHSAKETQYTLQRVVPRASAPTAAPILVRMDSGFDSRRLIGEVLKAGTARQAEGGVAIDVLVKWNPRRQGREYVLSPLKARTDLSFIECRAGKRQACWSEVIVRRIDAVGFRLQRYCRVTERSIDRHGLQLLITQWEIEGWETRLEQSTADVIALYADHGTHEQFHSEFKTDLDFERLPSGKFDTNDTVLSLAVLAHNGLRLIGQGALLGPDSPVRHPAKRRRPKTVMQEIIYRAATVIRHGGQCALDFGLHCSAAAAFQRLVNSWRIRLA